MKYKPQAVLGLSNFGGISIMLDPDNDDYLYYKYYNDKPERVVIVYIVDEDLELVPTFSIGNNIYYRLDEFIRIDY